MKQADAATPNSYYYCWLSSSAAAVFDRSFDKENTTIPLETLLPVLASLPRQGLTRARNRLLRYTTADGACSTRNFGVEAGAGFMVLTHVNRR